MKILKKFKKIWDNDPKDIIIPILSILIFVVAYLTIGLLKALIIFVAINVIYFGVTISLGIYNKKRRNSNKIEEDISNLETDDTNNLQTDDNSKLEIEDTNKGIEIDMKKEKKKKNKKKSKVKKVFKILLIIFLIFFILGIVAFSLFIAYIVKNAPEFDESKFYVSEPSKVLKADGTLLAELGEQKRTIISYDEIPEVLIDAIVATEDSRFFEHNGVDWSRFLTATIYQLIGKPAGGASTLTMQISKKQYTSDEADGIEGIIRKFTDVYVASNIIEKKYSKEQIMEFYVNSQWLAKNTFGVEQTAITYFNKSAKDLNLAEAAMIAGLFQAPGRYDPYSNPEGTEKRRLTVLNLMLRHEYITEEEYEIAKKMTVEKIVVPKEENQELNRGLSDYQSFIDAVVDEVEEKTGKNPYTTPMTIYTTINTDIQDYLNDIMNGETFDWENDIVKAGIAIVNVKDGSVVALGGNRGNSEAVGLWNYATDIEKHIGSTAKPLYDYGPAIEYNNWSSYQQIVDEPTSYTNGPAINNWDGGYQGLETIRVALMGSRNIPALKTFKAVDKQNIIEFTTNLGLTPEIYSCPEGYKRKKKICINESDSSDIIDASVDSTLHEAHSIGGYTGESPLSMAAAYAAFANNGIYTKPYTFTKVIFNDTNEEYINKVETTKAMSEETAYIISDMLASTAPSALGGYYNINGIRYAGKTGTSNYPENTMRENNLPQSAVNDLWVVGFNTEYSIGVWYGYNDVTEGYNTFASLQHGRLFQAIGRKVFTNSNYFTKPSGVVAVEVESGCPEAMLPSEYTPASLRQTELFIKGTEPTTVSERFAKLSNVSNLKASTVGNKIVLNWDQVETPRINTASYLKSYYSKLFLNESYLNAHVNNIITYNNNNIGEIGYNVYKKNANGDLELLDFVTTNKYEIDIKESGEYTFVVKTAYSIFKNNMSDGSEVKAKIQVTGILPDKDDNDSETENNKPDTDKGEETKPETKPQQPTQPTQPSQPTTQN